MSANSKIEWTDATWPVVVGCTKISPGCDNCYAIRDSLRLGAHPNPKIRMAYEGTARIQNGRPNWTGWVRCVSERLDWPLKWNRPRRIFVCNESDLFHEAVPADFIQAVFDVMERARQHTFQILTKRPERMSQIVLHLRRVGGLKLMDLPLPNVQLGMSVSVQSELDEQFEFLLRTPAHVRFLSLEPLLSPICLLPWLGWAKKSRRPIHWVIAGGESGPRARPAHPDWFRAVRNSCKAHGIAFFFKAWGGWTHESQLGFRSEAWPGPDVNGKQYHRWGDGSYSYLVGKKAAGRLLDGRVWEEYPTPAMTQQKAHVRF